MSGRYLEDLKPGDRITHPIRRTVTETDNLLFSTLTHNPQPLHIDAEYARTSEFGQIAVNSTFSFSLLVGITVAETTLGTLAANLGFDAVKTPHPVFLGDTVHAETGVIEVRESRSRLNAGIVVFAHSLINQRDETVCTCTRTALLHRRPA